MRPFALLLFSVLLLGCDPPGGSAEGSAQNPPDPPPFAWVGDYIITNSTKAVVAPVGAYFKARSYPARSVYLGTLHVGADRSASIASIEADFQASGAQYRVDFSTALQDPDNPPASIAETAYPLQSVAFNNEEFITTTAKIPASYERALHLLALDFQSTPSNGIPQVNIIAGTSAADPWTLGSTNILGVDASLIVFPVQLERKN